MVNLVNALAVVPPDGLWEKIIFAFNNGFGNYAVAIIFVTLCIKLLLLPVDYFNRRSSVKMTEVQTKLGPKLAEIQRKHPDKMVQNQKTQELYKKEGFNPMGSCLTMLVVMVVSMGVFFTLFASLNNVAAYKITNQYEQLQKAYVQEYVMDEKGITEEEFNELELTSEEIGNYIITISESGDVEGIIKVANDSVKEKYAEVKESFLWIKNVWMADSPTQNSIPSFESYAQVAKLQFEEEAQKERAKAEYNAVMGELEKTEGVNGFFILAVLAGVTAFLYQYLLTKKKKAKDQNFYEKNAQQNPQANQGKAMMFILPIIMVVFTLSYNSIFALYIIISQLFGVATAPLINKLISLPKKKKQTK